MEPMVLRSASARRTPIPSVQDERDHKALIETLTNQVVPLYYKRDAIGLAPRLDRPAEERLPDAGLAVQRGPDGHGLRAARLPARGRGGSLLRDRPMAADSIDSRLTDRTSSTSRPRSARAPPMSS